MTSTDADKLITAASQAVAERDRALEEAARLLHPDPVGVVAELLVQLKMVRGDRDALAADMDAIRGMVGWTAVPIVEAVRWYCDDENDVRNDIRRQRDDAGRWIGKIATALGFSEHAPPVVVRDGVKTQRTAAADLRDALDRVAAAVGVESDSTGAIVADLVVDAIRRLSSDRDQMRVARKDAAEDLERLNAILSSAGIDTTGPAADVADRVAAALRRPALPADLRAYLEARRGQMGIAPDSLAEIVSINNWLALPTAEVKP